MNRLVARFAVVFALYAAAYAADSALGGYWPMPEEGSAPAGLSEPEDILWQPRFGYRSWRRTTPLGWAFAPAIAADRRWVHRSRRIFIDDYEDWLFKTAPLTDFHPEGRESVRLTRLAKARFDAVGRAAMTEPEALAAQKAGDELARKTGWR